MADFLDKVLVGINKGVASVSEGSKNLMEKARMTTAANDAEKEMTRLLEEIGKGVYNFFKAGTSFPEGIEALCQDVAKKEEEVAAAREKLAAMEAAKEAAKEGMVYCSSCGARIKNDSKFCGKCGAPQNK